MEEGPFRMPRPADRSAASKPEPAQRPKQEPQPVKKEEPKPEHRPVALHRVEKEPKEKKPKKAPSFKRFKVPAFVVAVVAVVGVASWFAFSSLSVGTGIDDTKYQAVFFTNGQVYFGKLHIFNGDYMKLTDIYYLQTQSGDQTSSKNPQKATTDSGNVQLIKLGDEIHAPEDAMMVAKDQVLFFENLKPKGKVAQSIDSYKKSH